MLTQLDPPIPLEVLEKGKGQAIAVIDYGPEHHLIWVTAIDASGEIWCAPNPQVRLQRNWTMGRRHAPTPKSRETIPLAADQACACHTGKETVPC